MENINITTSQNVVIGQSAASVGERIAAALLDYLLLAPYVALMLIIGNNSSAGTGYYTIVILPILFYNLVCELTMDGQNLGKRIMKIKVVKLDGSQTGFVSYFIRWVFRIVDSLILFGSVATITVILNGKGQRLGDIAAGTTVIRLNRKASLGDTLHVEVSDNYKVVYQEAINLSDKDIYTIKEVVDFYNKGELSIDSAEMVRKTKEAIEKKIYVKSTQLPIKFLKTLLVDYNALNKVRKEVV